MVLEIPKSEWITLSHKERRRLIKKEKRRRLRQKIAQDRAEAEEEFERLKLQPEYAEKLAEEERRVQKEEAERQLQYEAWLERDRKSHAEFCEKREKEEQKLREREERERMIREEWEALERKEKQAKENKEKAKSKKEELLEKALSEIDQTMQEQGNLLDVHMPWHNPYAPIDMAKVAKAMNLLDDDNEKTEKQGHGEENQEQPPQKDNYGTEKDKINCPFFIKTGACRYGDHCSRVHPIPNSSTTLIIRGMYNHVVLTQQLLDEHDEDVGLEMDDEDMLKDFKEFYQDVFPEFEKFGEVVQFKVSCNYESHLRGNLYVQYSTEEACAAAIKQFNGRYYAGKQLSCEYCPVEKWKTAICGEFLKQGSQCPKGKHCNFLHVFNNPDGKFNWNEDDGNNRRNSRRSGSPRRRYGGRDGGYRRYSRSPPNRRYYKRGSDSPRDRRRSSISPGSRRRRSPDFPSNRKRSPSDRRRSPVNRRGSRGHRSRSPRERRRSPSPYRRDRRGRRHSSSDYLSHGRSSSSYESDSDLSPVRKGSERDKKKESSSSRHHKKKHKKEKKRSSKKKHKRRESSTDSESD
ncbi:PREDICTED: U2 small nuclear ribonucleoprotein auxiliary factor 35 kDa subunit-related protein 2-like [Amphimedon queenslandica]|uniref:Uncharacterized protein n=1 Tax=Amphimedon queenslandica TaxID=400682 RepID=A0A1X7V4Y8_AMPQE|nr:PREDICTED: U2 small nuclear ribonucleoprotein auxiliary factor 35 kDa subunit-related protein 2-like [Amphimedon queenslandica]|eukprot:XP_019850645.1 PREDICTED: U2 small nuclear ribonucleoprotein auxiliary factor 35 kDa subunit-related protein 2-like [Amphimedon queenslandica]